MFFEPREHGLNLTNIEIIFLIVLFFKFVWQLPFFANESCTSIVAYILILFCFMVSSLFVTFLHRFVHGFVDRFLNDLGSQNLTKYRCWAPLFSYFSRPCPKIDFLMHFGCPWAPIRLHLGSFWLPLGSLLVLVGSLCWLFGPSWLTLRVLWLHFSYLGLHFFIVGLSWRRF